MYMYIHILVSSCNKELHFVAASCGEEVITLEAKHKADSLTPGYLLTIHINFKGHNLTLLQNLNPSIISKYNMYMVHAGRDNYSSLSSDICQAKHHVCQTIMRYDLIDCQIKE